MRNVVNFLIGISFTLILGLILHFDVYAAPGSSIESGVFADDIELSGMTAEDAAKAIETRVSEWGNKSITLTDGMDYSVSFTPSEVGYAWNNKEIVSQAAALGKSGNIIQRYKALKDLSRQKQIYEIVYSVDKTAITDMISNCALEYDKEAVDATMTKSGEGFDITEGKTGRTLDVETTAANIAEYLVMDWDGQDATINMAVNVVEPRGSYEELSKVKDVLGTYTTSYTTSGSSRSANIANACGFINGTLMYPGDEFSTLDKITPFTESNGYFLAGSYLNGQVVESFGGGICQVSTTLYNAVLLSELEVTERYNHSMIISYVKPSMDAAIAESSGKNFKFVNNTEYPIYVEGYTKDKNITFYIYGVETRPSTHKVTYESETLERNVPETDAVYTDAGKPAGYCSGIQSAHIGYKARLWKNTYENGVLESREEVNKSTYNKSPRSVTIGVSTDNVDIYNMLMNAAASGSADTAAAAAAQAAAAVAAAQPPQPEEPQQQIEVVEVTP